MLHHLCRCASPVREPSRRLLLCLLVTLALTGCPRDRVRLQVEPDADQYVWRVPVTPGRLGEDCRALRFTIEAPLGYARGRAHRLEGFRFHTRIRWNVFVEPLCDVVDELHRRHNRAEISVAEFESQRELLARSVSRLQDYRSELEDAMEEYDEARDALLRADADALVPEMWRRLQSARERAEGILEAAAQLADSVLDQDARTPPADDRSLADG